jgi:hypothetical protein
LNQSRAREDDTACNSFVDVYDGEKNEGCYSHVVFDDGDEVDDSWREVMLGARLHSSNGYVPAPHDEELPTGSIGGEGNGEWSLSDKAEPKPRVPGVEEAFALSVLKSQCWAVTAAEDVRALEGAFWLARLLEEPYQNAAEFMYVGEKFESEYCIPKTHWLRCVRRGNPCAYKVERTDCNLAMNAVIRTEGLRGPLSQRNTGGKSAEWRNGLTQRSTAKNF